MGTTKNKNSSIHMEVCRVAKKAGTSYRVNIDGAIFTPAYVAPVSLLHFAL